MLLFFEFIPPTLFLILYFVSVIIGLIGLSVGKSIVEGDNSPQLKIPNLSNTHQQTGTFSLIAYMMRGTSGVSEVLLLGLIQKGYLQRNTNDDSILEQAPQYPDIKLLTTHELQIFDCFTHPLTIKEAFDMSILKNAIQEAGVHYEKQLIDAGLILPEKTYKNFKNISKGVFFSLLLMGISRIYWALSLGYTNIGFIVMIAAFCLISFPISFSILFKRITKKGKNYLNDLKIAFSSLKSKVSTEYGNAQIQGIPSEYLPLVSVFGLSVLSENEEYKRLSADSGTSCSSGFDGGGSDSGGSDSGSSGGDGGSGCGGGSCGGGCGGGD
ncbi:MAG: TIGR04222 domain-containing membrane protein [Cytophagia bacterium]|nr:MAG: TIGR04222 domain-containing membrane protein [Cytophagia bacterium]TAG44158.1 MAG: TIGR04222 domain-containing membrane protein [Cytophagia bacterium]